MDEETDDAVTEQLQSSEDVAEEERYFAVPLMSQFSPTPSSDFDYIDAFGNGSVVSKFYNMNSSYSGYNYNFLQFFNYVLISLYNYIEKLLMPFANHL